MATAILKPSCALRELSRWSAFLLPGWQYSAPLRKPKSRQPGECIVSRQSENDGMALFEVVVSPLSEDRLPLPLVARLRVNVLIRHARRWRMEALELRRQLAELQPIVDRSISGLDPRGK